MSSSDFFPNWNFDLFRKLQYSIKQPSLGGKIPMLSALAIIESHRIPRMNPETYDAVALTGVFFERRFKELWEFSKERIKTLKEPELSIFKAGLKEQAIKEVYKNELPKRIAEGYYEPMVIPKEVEKILGPLVDMSKINFNNQNLYHLLTMEAEKYAIHLTAHQLHYIKRDVLETISLYLKAFPSKSNRNAFILGCDLIRIAVYQEIFDKASFTGSDHGSKHIHHNIKNAESLHRGMQQHVDYTDKDRFLERLIHFYHDIGYTVGLAGRSFACCKDHPFIGAKMIEENMDYFEYHLDKESTDILWNAVLLHAIAMPNLTPGRPVGQGLHPFMVRAVTSLSDACALTYDRKTQEFWEQPETLLALIRLRLFLAMYPDYISKLSHSGKDEWYRLDKDNPLDVFAHDVFQNTKQILFKAVDCFKVPEGKKELFRQAIKHQFNSLTASVTLGQFGGELTEVSSVKNLVESIPKFLPQFGLAPSIIYGTLCNLFGDEQAQASFKKLTDEFSADLNLLAKEINETARKADIGLFALPKVLRSGNAYFVIQSHDVKNTDKHFNDMQLALVKVAKKVDTLYQGKMVSLTEKNKVLSALKEFRIGKSGSCETFSDFVIEHVLPNLTICQPKEAAENVKRLTGLVKQEVLQTIRKADAQWTEIMSPLISSDWDLIRADIVRFLGELEKMKGKISDPKSHSAVSEASGKLLKAAANTPGVDGGRLAIALSEIAIKLRDHASLFDTAEKKYHSIENGIKLALVTEREYLFMRGKKRSLEKGECMAQLIEC